MKSTIAIMISGLLVAGCGGTWVDDKHNFERAFGAKCPPYLRVVHSFYVQTPHFTEEHDYYFDLMPVTNLMPVTDSPLPRWLTNAPGIVRAAPDRDTIPLFFPDKDYPKWFAPEAPTNYEIWHGASREYVVLRHRRTGEIFVHDRLGM
jgi:hypothetical protein